MGQIHTCTRPEKPPHVFRTSGGRIEVFRALTNNVGFEVAGSRRIIIDHQHHPSTMHDDRSQRHPDEHDFEKRIIIALAPVVAPFFVVVVARQQQQFPRSLVSAFVESLLQAGATTGLDVYPRVRTLDYSRRLVVTAAFDGNPNTIRRLLTMDTAANYISNNNYCFVNEPNAMGECPLQIAAGRGHRAAVRTLLDYGAEVNATAQQPDRCQSPRVLLQGMSALHRAALQGHSGVVKDLIAAGADKNAKVTRSGESPLHLAARCGHHTTVSVLLDSGVDAIMLSRSNLSPLDLAACNNHPITIGEFLHHGVDPNKANPLGYTAVHQAAYHNAVDALEVLIDAGGRLDAVAHGGFTPLHVAAFAVSNSAGTDTVTKDKGGRRRNSHRSADSPSAVVTLVRHGGEVDATDASGHTPLRLACAYMREQAVADLLREGANEDLLVDLPDSMVSKNGAALPTSNNRDVDAATRVMAMLAGAPAGRAWRRRGWLVLLRRHTLEYARQGCGINTLIAHDPRASRNRVDGFDGISEGSCYYCCCHGVKRRTSEVGVTSVYSNWGGTESGFCAHDGRGVFAGSDSRSVGFFEAAMRTVAIEDDNIFCKIVGFL